jgi:hypothetical protein
MGEGRGAHRGRYSGALGITGCDMVKIRNFTGWLSRDSDPCFGFTSLSF